MPAGFRDVSHETGLDQVRLASPRALIAFDYDGDGAPDLLITQNGGPPVLLRNRGGAKHNSVRIALKGEHDNKSGSSRGGTHEQHVKAGEQSHKNTSQGGSEKGSSHSGSGESSGGSTRGGTHEQHVKAGQQSHKND